MLLHQASSSSSWAIHHHRPPASFLPPPLPPPPFLHMLHGNVAMHIFRYTQTCNIKLRRPVPGVYDVHNYEIHWMSRRQMFRKIETDKRRACFNRLVCIDSFWLIPYWIKATACILNLNHSRWVICYQQCHFFRFEQMADIDLTLIIGSTCFCARSWWAGVSCYPVSWGRKEERRSV